MNDYINREKARNEIVSLMKEMKLTIGGTTVWEGFTISPTKAVYALKRMPSADVVEVVRCKECEHYKDSATGNRKACFRKDADGIPVCYDFLPDDWCKYGEMKSFGIEVSDVMSIIDKFNEVGNIHAISSGDIGEALQRVANTSLDESITFITAANTVVQNPETVKKDEGKEK